eukprot:CAMPEP_0180374848 /NCGR_PEP_ID=MMETSP0989-20121125/22254_1 /TAXON_ID=697907 /ORGANISM="non described non described, Strain CCMP2293" /LENGTH=320 /DNA_ID=CAMNT_0022372331 /DNA_START=171 /DNA_END=1133 /DNA_ORIENTATION=+
MAPSNRMTALACLSLLLLARGADSFMIGIPHHSFQAPGRYASALHAVAVAERHDALLDAHFAHLFDADTHTTRFFDFEVAPACSPTNRLHEEISHDADAGSTVLVAVSNECHAGFLPLANVSVTVSKDQLTLSAAAATGEGRTVLRTYTLTHDAAANAANITASLTADGAIQLHIPNTPAAATNDEPRRIPVAPAPAQEEPAAEPAAEPAVGAPAPHAAQRASTHAREGTAAEARARAELRAANPFDGIEAVEGEKGGNDILDEAASPSPQSVLDYEHAPAATGEKASATDMGDATTRFLQLEAELASLRKFLSPEHASG